MKQIDDKDYELIVRYHDYDLNDGEMQAVLKRMAEDKDFEKQVYGFGKLNESLEHKDRIAEKEKTIEKWKKLSKGKVAKRKIRPYFYIRKIAAAVLLLLFVSVPLYYNYVWSVESADEYTSSQLEIVMKNLSYDSMVDLAEEDDNDPMLKVAYETYEQKDYPATITTLQSISMTSKNYEDAQLFLAKIYIKQKKCSVAIAILETLHNSTTKKDEVLWLQALAYIQHKEPQKAKGNLSILISEGYPKAELAKELLEKLD